MMSTARRCVWRFAIILCAALLLGVTFTPSEADAGGRRSRDTSSLDRAMGTDLQSRRERRRAKEREEALKLEERRLRLREEEHEEHKKDREYYRSVREDERLDQKHYRGEYMKKRYGIRPRASYTGTGGGAAAVAPTPQAAPAPTRSVMCKGSKIIFPKDPTPAEAAKCR